jgi:hypothetical protein
LPGSDPDDEGPADIVEFRMALARRMSTFLGAWRSCDRPACKRHHACVDKAMACTAKQPRLTPQQSERAAGSMYKALQRVMISRGLVDGPVAARKRGARKGGN